MIKEATKKDRTKTFSIERLAPSGLTNNSYSSNLGMSHSGGILVVEYHYEVS